jgi:SAM dependent carboxyl methyltransferase
MSKQVTTAHAVMEGGCSYNAHAKSQATGGMLGLPFLEQAVREMTIPEKNEAILIADYGSSQGKNSVTPMRVAIRALRARVGADRPISVTHIDQPANDFNILFDVLHRDPHRYTLDDRHVFPNAIGRSFYEQVFPPDSVHFGWSSHAAMWLSRVPTFVTGNFRGNRGTAAECEAFRRPRNGNTPGEQELRESARKSLADYKVLEKIFFLPQLPKGPTGKVHRATLKTMLIEKKP